MDDQDDIVEKIPRADKPEKPVKRKPRAKKVPEVSVTPVDPPAAPDPLASEALEIAPVSPRLYQLRSPGVRPGLAPRPPAGRTRFRNDCPPDSRKNGLPHPPRTRLR